jgi:hypothetical protein
MACKLCGHSNSDHKSVTSGMFYCSTCNIVEQGVSFSVDSGAGNTSDPSKSDDVQADMYRSIKRMARPRYE